MLYTRKGDTGTTKLFGCSERIAKSSAAVEALGSLDELIASIGVAKALARDSHPAIAHTLSQFQNTLFSVTAIVAGAPTKLPEDAIVSLEVFVADVEKEIPPITSFTVPGATLLSAELDRARTVCRRAERCVCEINQPSLVPYLNRLSSCLFATARLAAFREGVIPEEHPSY